MNIVNTTKAVQAFVLGMVVSGLVTSGLTSCQNTAEMAQMLAPEESGKQGKTVQTAQEQPHSRAEAMATLANLSPAEREQKIREILSKPEFKEMTAGLEELARAVAVAVEDADVRNRIYERCMEKFDGETNVLWKHLEVDTKVRGKAGLSWNARVESVLQKSGNARTVNAVGGVGRGVERFEKTMNGSIHLFWAFPDNWDKKTAPLVAFVPRDIDPLTLRSITAFDAKGHARIIANDGIIAKKLSIIVITFNERTDMGGKVKSGLILSNSVGKKVQLAKKTQEGYAQINNTAAPQCGTFVRCKTIETRNIYETWWWDGGPEFEYSLTLAGKDLQNRPSAIYLGYNYIGWGNAVHTVESRNTLCFYDPTNGLPSSFTAETAWYTIYEDNGWDMYDRYLTNQAVPLNAYDPNYVVQSNDPWIRSVYAITNN
jgi:hypothetical protein